MPGAATISRFDVPSSVRCRAGASTSVRADYATDAALVRFTIDNVEVAVGGSSPTTGSFDVPLPCTGSIHTIVLSAFDANGHATVQSRAVLADDGNDG
jgi:hypothetical protein